MVDNGYVIELYIIVGNWDLFLWESFEKWYKIYILELFYLGLRDLGY